MSDKSDGLPRCLRLLVARFISRGYSSFPASGGETDIPGDHTVDKQESVVPFRFEEPAYMPDNRCCSVFFLHQQGFQFAFPEGTLQNDGAEHCHFAQPESQVIFRSGSLFAFSFKVPEGIGVIFYVHLFILCVLIAYFPFSKLMHFAGVFLSPTRNLANNNRFVRHVNPWDYPVKYHTYEAYEDEFREHMIEAGIPVEKGAEPAEEKAEETEKE